MAPVKLGNFGLASVLPRGGLTLVQGCSGESTLLAEAVVAAGEALGDMCFTGIFIPGLNRANYVANPACRVQTFFLTPELKRQGEAVEFLPFCYADIFLHLRRSRIAAALFTVAPPDENGLCSFGTTVDFLAELWPQIPVRIAHINPAMPRTGGHNAIPYAELTAVIEADVPLLGTADDPPDAVSHAIGKHAAAFIPDGATLQMGIGKVPGGVLQALRGHRNLRIHSGLISDAILDLAAAGALAAGQSITAGVAIGSRKLYDAVAAPEFSFRPVPYTHGLQSLAGLEKFVTINSAISVDLFGQVYAELTPRGLMSGPGGASDFARGAKAAGGLRIIALPASAGAISRILPAGAGNGPVSLGRMDTDIIITEHGAVDLRGLGHHRRAEALIAIADPTQRETLQAGWQDFAKRL